LLPVAASAGVVTGTTASAVVQMASVKSRIANLRMRPSLAWLQQAGVAAC
jgi:hypothetical protein